MVQYKRRVVDEELDLLMPQLPAMLLDGPKAVGKTETASRRVATVLDMSRPEQHALVAAAPDSVLAEATKPVLVDEWHLLPVVWDAVKRAVDRDRSGGQFVLAGSAPIVGSPAHTGAGRITTLRMRPMTLPERGVAAPTVSLERLLTGERDRLVGTTTLGLAAYVDELLRSGLPGSQHLDGRALRQDLTGYLDRIVERDVVDAGRVVRRPAALRAWLRAYAAATATDASWERLRDAATPGLDDKPARTTTTGYVETLTALRVLDELEAWTTTGSRIGRLTRSAKHHVVDPALAARLVGVDRDMLLTADVDLPPVPRDGTFLGALFESLVVMHLRVFAQAAEARTAHLRTRGGRHEVDVIVERGDGRVVAVEVKLSGTIRDDDVRHLRWLGEQIGDQLLDAVVISTGPGAYRREDGIAVVPLGLIGP